MFPHLFPESLEIFDSLTPRKPRRGVMSLGGPRVRGAATPLPPLELEGRHDRRQLRDGRLVIALSRQRFQPRDLFPEVDWVK